MPEYTESQIRSLTGEQLRWATWELCQIPNCYDVLQLDVCVPMLMGEGGVLETGNGKRYAVGPVSGNQWRLWELVALLRSDESDPFPVSDDPATAICRAACLVALREGE